MNNSIEIALANCAKEPIHIPGSIQPHGFFVMLNVPDLEIIAVSENIAQFTGIEAKKWLSKHIKALLDESTVEILKQSRNENTEVNNPQRCYIKNEQQVAPFDMMMTTPSQFPDRLLLDFELANDSSSNSYHTFYNYLNETIIRFQNTTEEEQLFQISVKQLKQITGFHRVMLYRFDEEWNGEVVAEDLEEILEPYLGLHYPASDIPAQARALYEKNKIRIIANVDYIPSPLLVAPSVKTPIDLTYSSIRSVSPVHIEYLKNMGVKASMSVSILVNDKLWGLFACHHYQPLKLNFQTRRLCELVSNIFASHFNLLQEKARNKYEAQLQVHKNTLLRQITQCGDVHKGLVGFETTILKLVNCSGAAVCIDDNIVLLGKTPALPFVKQLLNWLSELDENIFYTHQLYKFYEPAERNKQTSGLLAIAISRSTKEYILWFREEVVQTVFWAGNPNKSVEVSNDNVIISPRKSFEAWKQLVKNTSLAWQSAEIKIATTFREDLLGIVIKNANKLKRANKALEKANKKLSKEIKQRIATEKQLIKAKLAAEEMNRLKTNFLANMSHEIRTPINGIIGLTKVIELEFAEKEPAVLNYTELIKKSGKRLLNTINSIIDIARIEAEKIQVYITTADVLHLTTESVKLLLPIAKEKGLYLTVVPPKKQIMINTDETLTHQVLNNIIGNAIKFTEQGGVTISFEVKNYDNETPYCEIIVSDTGIGMDEAFLKQLYQPFQQESKGYNRKYEGSGLGLAISKSYMELMGGKISVKTRINQGTTFRLAFPLNQKEKLLSPTENPINIYPEKEIKPNKKVQVLIVEDDEINALVLQKQLSNYQVAWVKDSDSALEQINRYHFDVVLMDINLGNSKLDGTQILEQIRKNSPQPNLKVMAITSYAMRGDREKFLSMGFDAYFAKPIEAHQIIKTIESFTEV